MTASAFVLPAILDVAAIGRWGCCCSLQQMLASMTSMAIVVVLALVLLINYWKNKKPFADIPMAPGNHWLYGHIHLFLQSENFEEALTQISHASKDGLVGLWAGKRPIVSVSDVDLARTILQVSSQRHPPRLVLRFLYKFVGRYNLITLNGKEWKYHRDTVASTFCPEFLQESQISMEQVAMTMVHSLQKQIFANKKSKSLQIMDVEALMKMIAMDIFGRTALSTDLGSCQRLTPTPLVQAFEFLMEDQMDRLRSPLLPQHFFFSIPTRQNKRHQRERDLIRCFVADLLNEKRDILKDGDRDLLSHLIQAHASTTLEQRRQLRAQDISDEALTDVLMTLLLAGHHTISATLTFCLYLLAQHPDQQTICQEEIQTVLATTATAENDNTTVLHNHNMYPYCSAVLTETLRIFPPAIRTSRYLDRPVKLERTHAGGGVFVAPTGTRVHIPIWSIHHDNHVFPQAESFRPDRWAMRSNTLGNNDDDNTNPPSRRWIERPPSDTTGTIPAGNRNAMLAFSAGARSCVGRNFAMQEAVLVLVTLLQHLELQLVPGYQLQTSTRNFLLRPKGPLPLLVSTR